MQCNQRLTIGVMQAGLKSVYAGELYVKRSCEIKLVCRCKYCAKKLTDTLQIIVTVNDPCTEGN